MRRLLGDLWALPWTLVGLALAKATGCVRWRNFTTGITFWRAIPPSPFWDWWRRTWGTGAITIGTVIICAVDPTVDLLLHERRHQRQARVLGPLYVPLYLIGCIVGALRGHWRRDNPMEVHARGE